MFAMDGRAFGRVAVHGLAGVVLLVVAVAGAWAGDSPAAGYHRLLEAGKFEQTEAMLDRLSHDARVLQDERWRLLVDLAKAQRHQGKGREALRTLDRLDRADRQRTPARIELAWAHVLEDELDQARPYVKSLAGSGEAEARCHGRYLLARLAFEDKQYQQAIEHGKRALRAFREVDYYHNPDGWELRQLKTDTRKLMEEAQHKVIAKKYGSAYANYRRARIAEASRDYKQAISYYRRVQEMDAPVLADAAGCYIGGCLVQLDHKREAVDYWQGFIKHDEEGLYRGEAMLKLGRLLLVEAQPRATRGGRALDQQSQALAEEGWPGDAEGHARIDQESAGGIPASRSAGQA